MKFKNKYWIILSLTLVLLGLLFIGCGKKETSKNELKDGTYSVYVSMEGGSGKAYIESPCSVEVKGDKKTATIVWSSENYDYMIVGEEKYLPVNDSGVSVFEIPIEEFDVPMTVVADTTAMSKPHEIEYQLTFSLEEGEKEETSKSDDTDTKAQNKDSDEDESIDEAFETDGLVYTGEVERRYASGFRIYEFEDGYREISLKNNENYLLNISHSVDEGIAKSAEEANIVVLKEIPEEIYMAATAAMSLVDAAGAVDNISYSSIKQEDWSIADAKEAMKNGDMVYAGKYSAPDYEMLLAGGCDLAIESTMILHTPKVEEKLEELDIPVFVDRASYEENPLGRLEWVLVYGTLLGHESRAKEFFEEQCRSYDGLISEIEEAEDNKKTVCFFYVNSAGKIVTRKSDDYIATMIESVGGDYLPDNLGTADDSASGTITISVEEFYAQAKDSDILIYNGSIDSPPKSIDELLEIEEVFSDFSAVKNNKVYTSDASLYQRTDATVDIMVDFYNIISEKDEFSFFTKVE